MLYNAVYSLIITICIGLIIGFFYRGQTTTKIETKRKIMIGLGMGIILLMPYLFFDFSYLYYDTLILSWITVAMGFLTTFFSMIPLYVFLLLNSEMSSINMVSILIFLIIGPMTSSKRKLYLKYTLIILLPQLMINSKIIAQHVNGEVIIFYNFILLLNLTVLIVIHILFQRYNHFFHSIREFAIIDKESNLYNHVYFDNYYANQETKQSFAIIDFDLLTNYENLYGYTITNKIMHTFSQLILKRLKDVGIVFRYNSDQFYILFQKDDEAVCFNRMQLLKDEIENLSLSIEGNTIKMTASIGLKLNGEAVLIEQLIDECELALVQSKIMGRNKITIA